MRRIALAAVLVATGLAMSAHAAPAVWETLPAPIALPAPAASGFVQHDGARIWYATFGKGEPVILLHGGLSNSEVWGGLVPALTRTGHRVILIDSRGHGRSTRDARPYTYELMASDVVAVMDQLQIRRAAVVGWSDGGIIGLIVALKTPERLTRVFAFGANMDPSGNVPHVDAVPTFAQYERGAAADYRRLSTTPNDFSALAHAIGRMWDTEPNYTAADLAHIHTPVAIADGDHDEAIKREHMEFWRGRSRGRGW